MTNNPVGAQVVGFVLFVFSGGFALRGEFTYTAFCLTLLLVLTLGWYAIQGWDA